MSDATIELIVGMRGMGKSTLAVHKVRRLKMPVVVIDPTGAWAKDLKVNVSGSLRAVAGKIRQHWNQNFRIVYTPPPNHEAEALHLLSEILFKVQAGFKSGESRRQIMLVVEEANMAYPSNQLPARFSGFTAAILQGRHYGVNIMGITQRPALVHPNFRGNASVTHCLALSDDRSRSAVLEVCGNRHKKALQSLQQFEYLEIAFGQVKKLKVPKPRR